MALAGQVNAGLGCRIYIGTTADDAESDSYIEIGEVVSLPPVGPSYNTFTFAALADGAERTFMSTQKGGAYTIPVGRKASDAGQAACIAAVGSHLERNFKITLNDSSETTDATPTTLYFKARIAGYETGPFAIGSVVQATITLARSALGFIDNPAT
jgi:hypothetical protein